MKNVKPKNISSFRKSERGFGLIEVMIAVGLIVMIAAGTSKLIQDNQKEVSRVQLGLMLTNLQMQFQSMLNDGRSWDYTVGDTSLNASLQCIKDRSVCQNVAADYQAGLPTIVLKDGGNNIFYDGRSTNSQGFTFSGQRCEGFSASGPGNDQCPIGYVVSWGALSGDVNPQAVLYAKLVFNPSETHPFKKFFNQDINLFGKYDAKSYKSMPALPNNPGNINVAQMFAAAGVPLPTGGTYSINQIASTSGCGTSINCIIDSFYQRNGLSDASRQAIYSYPGIQQIAKNYDQVVTALNGITGQGGTGLQGNANIDQWLINSANNGQGAMAASVLGGIASGVQDVGASAVYDYYNAVDNNTFQIVAQIVDTNGGYSSGTLSEAQVGSLVNTLVSAGNSASDIANAKDYAASQGLSEAQTMQAAAAMEAAFNSGNAITWEQAVANEVSSAPTSDPWGGGGY